MWCSKQAAVGALADAIGAVPAKRGELEPSGDEPLDPFVTDWSVVPEAVLVAISADGLGLVPLRNAGLRPGRRDRPALRPARPPGSRDGARSSEAPDAL
jgi:hypothetical protein